MNNLITNPMFAPYSENVFNDSEALAQLSHVNLTVILALIAITSMFFAWTVYTDNR